MSALMRVRLVCAGQGECDDLDPDPHLTVGRTYRVVHQFDDGDVAVIADCGVELSLLARLGDRWECA